MMYPNGEFDLFDDRFTPNSRGSYPLKYLTQHQAELARAATPRPSCS